MVFEISFCLSGTDKHVWLIKFGWSIFFIFVFSLIYFFSENVLISMAFTFLVAAFFSTIPGKHSVLFVSVIGVSSYLVFPEAFNPILASLCIALLSVVTFANPVNERHKINIKSNLFSAVIQFLILLGGFYLAQHITIQLSFSWIN